MSGYSVRPSSLPSHFHQVHGEASGHPGAKLYRLLTYTGPVSGDGRSISRCRPWPHLSLVLRLNTKKSVLSPAQRTTFLGVVWDSITMRAQLSPNRIESILAMVSRIKLGHTITLKQFQRLLGLMAAASNVITFGLLYMRPLQSFPREETLSV